MPPRTPTDMLPVMTGNTGFRTNLQTLWSIGVTVVGAAIWGTFMYLDVQSLKESDKEKTASINEMSRQLNGVESDIRRIRWILDPTAAATSRPVLTQPPTKANP
jgi:hypothetical protein